MRGASEFHGAGGPLRVTNQRSPRADVDRRLIAGRVTGTGPPGIFTTLGQHPRLFRAWLRYSAQLMPFGHLPRRDTELVILRVAWECRSAYEWHQHVPIALRVGLTPDEVAGVTDRTSEDVFTGRQQTLLAVSDELLAQRTLSDSTWSAVQATLGNREAIELWPGWLAHLPAPVGMVADAGLAAARTR